MPLLFPNGQQDILDLLEVPVGGRLISELFPKTIHQVQLRVIGREVFQIEMRMFSQERVDLRALMPLRSVHIEVDPPSGEPSVQGPQEFQESLSIPLEDGKESVPSAQGLHPAEEVEPLPMLALGGYLVASPSPHPETTQPGMKRKARLVPEDQGSPLSLQDRPEFFLRSRRKRGIPFPVAWSRR